MCDERFSNTDRHKIIMVMWEIWNSRNRWTHKRGSCGPIPSLKVAKVALAVLEVPKKHTTILPNHIWMPLEEDVVKIDINEGPPYDRIRGAGEVVRSHFGYIGAWSRPYIRVFDPLIAEALASCGSVIFAKVLWLPKVLMKTD
jgi:hypothetical protein